MRFSLRALMLSKASLAVCMAIIGLAVRNSDWAGIPVLMLITAPLYGAAGGCGVGLLLNKPIAGFFCGAVIVPTVEVGLLWVIILLQKLGLYPS